MSEPTILRVDVLGVGVSAINMAMAIAEIDDWIAQGKRHYVCVTGVHGVTESLQDEGLRRIHNESGLTTPDGMPLVWCGRKVHASWMRQVTGPDLMLEVAAKSVEKGWRWYLYGGGEGIPELLRDRLVGQYPGLRVVGTYSPPFRPLEGYERTAIIEHIDRSGADIVWVGLSTPKQERWMAECRPLLQSPAALIGVGAAFDIHAGVLSQAPRWMRHLGLGWCYRMILEPRRLTVRYLRANPKFLIEILRRPPTLTA